MQEKWNHNCLFSAKIERNVIRFMAAELNSVNPTSTSDAVGDGWEAGADKYPTARGMHRVSAASWASTALSGPLPTVGPHHPASWIHC